MSEENNEAATPPVTRVVPMSDGTTVDFGSRSKLQVSFDTVTETATFKVFTGEIISWVVAGMEGLNEFQKTVHMYGVVERVKSSLSPVKLEDLSEAINKQIAAINSGEFNIRGKGAAKASKLNQLQTAYAIAMSKLTPEVGHWNQVEEATVIAEVLASWEGKDAAQRNAVRRHPAVSLELSILKMAAGEGDAELMVA